jgi:hypothetical protein
LPSIIRRRNLPRTLIRGLAPFGAETPGKGRARSKPRARAVCSKPAPEREARGRAFSRLQKG